MKHPDAIAFSCDHLHCREMFTAMYPRNDTDAYLDLIGKGWKVDRRSITGWKHYCPEHSKELSR